MGLRLSFRVHGSGSSTHSPAVLNMVARLRAGRKNCRVKASAVYESFNFFGFFPPACSRNGISWNLPTTPVFNDEHVFFPLVAPESVECSSISVCATWWRSGIPSNQLHPWLHENPPPAISVKKLSGKFTGSISNQRTKLTSPACAREGTMSSD